jgi:DUF1680 family protein
MQSSNRLCAQTGNTARLTIEAQNATIVKPVHAPKIAYFSLRDVRLLDGEFKHIQEMTHRYLLTLEPDRLCSWFRREAGLTPKAQPYPNWESKRDHWFIIPGHILGFYLSSMAMMYETTGDSAILQRLEYTLNELDACQKAGGDGYIGAVINGRNVFEQVASGQFKTDLGDINGVGEPTYIINKITLGLFDVATKCNLPLAKKVLVEFANWFGANIVDKLDEPALQKLLVCEHGSLSESFIDVYRLTGEKRHLEWAKRLNDLRLLIPLSEGKDMLAGWHANCQIQKMSGFENVFRYTDEKKYTDAALFFWKTVVRDHTWIMGGNSVGEHFFPPSEKDNYVVKNSGPETCNSVNMLRLTEALYEDYALPEMLDYYENVLINHILTAYEPERGMVAYITKLQPGSFKTHSTEYNSFWCCTGTGFESPAKFQKLIYAHDENSLFVNFFIPSAVQWKEKGISLTQQTKIPDEEQTILEIQTDVPKEFSLKIRHPQWVENGQLKIFVNGKKQRINTKKSQFAEIKRLWKSGDKVAVRLPMKLNAEPLTPSEKFISFTYGPVVLAAEYDSGDLKKEDYWHDSDPHGHRRNIVHQLPPEQFSAFTGSPEDIVQKTKKISASPLTFRTEGGVSPSDYTLIPFYRIHYSRYLIYFPHNNPKEIRDRENQQHTQQEAESKLSEAEKSLDDKTIDRVVVADEKSEKQHRMEAVNSSTGQNFGRLWRHAVNGGYFMYELKCLPDKPQDLYFLFDGRDSGNRTFLIQVDGKTITTIDHSKPVSEGLYQFAVPIPPELTQGKETITVKLQAKHGNTAGGIFDLRVLKQE